MAKADRAERLKEQAKAREFYGKCPHCPLHGGENARRIPRDDRYKSKKKGR